MLIDKELVIRAKNTFGDKAIDLIRDYFKLENWSDRDSKGSCPFGHTDSDPSFIWNFKNNSFHCFGCGRNFGIIDLFMKQGLTYLEAVEKLFDETNTKYKFGERGIKTKRDYKYPIIECSEDRSKVDEYFATRKISKETLDYCNIGQDKNGNIVWKFYNENDVLLTVKLRPARIIKKGEEKEWYLQGYDNTPILFNMNRVDYSNGPLVITEGQSDTLSVIESGYLNVVSVPGGAQNNKWIEETFEFLERFDQLIIWSDSDDAGIKMRKEVVARLGQWRCKYVEIPEEYRINKEIKDANAILFKFGKQAVLDLITNAQEVPITNVINLAEVEPFDIEKAPGIFTEITEIDDIIYKFLFGNVMTVTGQRSAGKSSFVNQVLICEALNQGYDSFIFSGELACPVFKSWVDVTMAGPEKVTMKNKFVHQIDITARKQMESWYDHRIMYYDNKKDNTIDSILDRAIACTRKFGIKIWILDNLSVIDIGAKESDEYQKQKELMAKLIGLADLYNVLIVLVVHPRKLFNGSTDVENDDVAGAAALTNLAQYVISAKRFTDKEKQGDGKKKLPIDEDASIRILKNRYVGRTGEVKLYFDYRSRRFYNTKENLNKRYKWNPDLDKKELYDYYPLNNKLPGAMKD